MKKIIYTLMLLIASGTFYTCSNDDTATNPPGNTGTTTGSLTGEWTVDKVQMVQAPSGSTGSAMMKQALVPFGEVDASFAGYLDFTVGAENLSVTNMNTSLYYPDIYFIGNKGYTFAYNGTALEVSTNGGITWSSLNIPASPIAGFVYNENTVYMTSYPSTLSKSTNSGASWTTVNSNLEFSPHSGEWNSTFCFVNDLTGYANTYEGNFYKTTNGGANWNNIFNLGASFYYRNMKFFDELNGVILSQNTCSKTTDGGISWNEYIIGNSDYITTWFYLNSNIGWATSYDGIYKTNNGGQTWNQISEGSGQYQIKFVNENLGYCFDSEFLLKTTNSGINWINKYAMPPSAGISNIQLINGELAAFTYNQILKPNGITDTTKWVTTGRITNSAIKSITHAPDFDGYANGEFTTVSNNIIFTSYNYSGGHDDAVGVGTYSFDSGFLNIVLNLPNNEKWKIKLRKR